MYNKNSKYIDVKLKSEKLFPKNNIKQAEYIKEKIGHLYYAIYMIETLQQKYSHNTETKYEFEGILLDYLMRGYLDALNQLSNKLPEGIYKYISDRIESFFAESLKQTEEKRKQLQ